MDMISLLSDDLIFKILSLVPSKDVVTTSLLSKRWGSLWKHVPTLKYCDPSTDFEHWRALAFVAMFLLLHKAPVLENLDLSLSRRCPTTNIASCISTAVSRGLRNFRLFQFFIPIRLPRSLFMCETLVTLNLEQVILVDVPLEICLRSLKVLFMALGFQSDDVIIQRLLAGCPVLQDLKVIRYDSDNVKTFTITVPSLKRLAVLDLKYGSQVSGNDVGFMINAPSLMALPIASRSNWVCSLVKIPKLVKTNIKLRDSDSKNLLGCPTSAVKHLSLCVKPPMDPYPIVVFSQLVSLKLCTCSLDWFKLILGHTPLLRVLIFKLPLKLHPNINDVLRCCSRYGDVQTQWDQPSSVPQCLISSLETVEWRNGYKGTETEKKMVIYIILQSESEQEDAQDVARVIVCTEKFWPMPAFIYLN